MGKLFGTDGVRGIVASELNSELAMRIGASVARILKENKENITLLIGTDTRKSKDMLKKALAAGVLSEGVNVVDLGVIPTPAIAYLIKKYKAAGGFVISASHNPSEYNGIKVFNEQGYKLADELEEKVEDLILNDFKLNKETNNVGAYEISKTAKEDYVEFLKSTVSNDLSNLSVGVDTANGAAYETANMLFTGLGLNFKIINNTPDGLNINLNAGSTHLEGLQKFVLDNHLDCGIAFDGDADRCLLIDEKGDIVDGDKILAIIGNDLKENGKLKNNTIVGTVMSNLGFVKFCEKEGINFVATKVGDRYVLESMLQNDYIIGGEQSGHIIFKEHATTGDGELTALQILNVMSKTGKKLSELASIMDTYPQVLKNVNVSREGKATYLQNEAINKAIDDANLKLNGDGRILVRPSGTENLIRVMLEGKDIETITSICDDIVSVINSELN